MVTTAQGSLDGLGQRTGFRHPTSQCPSEGCLRDGNEHPRKGWAHRARPRRDTEAELRPLGAGAPSPMPGPSAHSLRPPRALGPGASPAALPGFTEAAQARGARRRLQARVRGPDPSQACGPSAQAAPSGPGIRGRSAEWVAWLGGSRPGTQGHPRAPGLHTVSPGHAKALGFTEVQQSALYFNASYRPL